MAFADSLGVDAYRSRMSVCGGSDMKKKFQAGLSIVYGRDKHSAQNGHTSWKLEKEQLSRVRK